MRFFNYLPQWHIDYYLSNPKFVFTIVFCESFHKYGITIMVREDNRLIIFDLVRLDH